MRVLLAFDKFKDSLTAAEACALASESLLSRHPDWFVDCCPLADGGEGFAEILAHAAGGKMESQEVTGPLGHPVRAAFGLVPLANLPVGARSLLHLTGDVTGVLAVIEMSAASGLALLLPTQRDPWQTTTVGTGELILRAVELNARAIVLGVGGSATSDLGLGALQALGLQFLGANGTEIRPPLPARWPEISQLRGNVRALPPIRIACDVTNPLLGRNGAAAVYGPQKGLAAPDVQRLDHAGARMALMLGTYCRQPDTLMDRPGAGAAGGLPFGLMTAAGAQLLPGFPLVAAWLDLETRLAAADIVLTGEGRFDDSSMSGKGPGAVVARALALGKPVHVFAGQVTSRAVGPAGAAVLHAITPADTSLEDALRHAAGNLAAAVQSTF